MIHSPRPKLLIAEDHAAMRQTMVALLASVASDIKEASDGAEAVRLFAEQQPDWVIMDIHMKPMNGLEATRQLRAEFPSARVVMVSEDDSPELRAQAAAAGACEYVRKDELAKLPGMIGRNDGMVLQKQTKETKEIEKQ
ncbi:MAG TPA: response regulator transcription factor [Candidatus Dormibacteraeota bacterium]|nr:response regulator transcription factor [Candidatus Dormibacteraeota bacterium]